MRCRGYQMPPTLNRTSSSSRYTLGLQNPNAQSNSALKPAELQVLRAQFEKEGEYVSLQTKFNYAWVRHIEHTSVNLY